MSAKKSYIDRSPSNSRRRRRTASTCTFGNVGGEHLEAAIGALKIHARIILSGMVSQYNDERS
jgi:hypothetical protein